MKNELRIDLAGNPGIASIFSGKKNGQKVSLEVRGKIKDLTTGEAVIAIDKVVAEEEDIKPEAEAPMMMEMKPGKERSEY